MYTCIYITGGKAQGAPEGSIRVPGLFRWPGVLPSGKTIDVPISTMDIFPLVAHAAGVSVPKDRPIDGKDILNVLKGDVQKSPHEFMFHYCDDIIHAARYIPTSGTLYIIIQSNRAMLCETGGLMHQRKVSTQDCAG